MEKKDGGIFDVTMGAYDGAEVCELVGTFLLDTLSEKYDKNNIGLYRDDGLAIFKNTNGQTNEKTKKSIQKIFKEKGLSIEIHCNKKIVNYLDVTFDLTAESFKPFRKPNDETCYIHAESNHPPNILKQIPIAVEKRISNLSSSETIFHQEKQYYQDALAKSGYTYQLKYNPTSANTNRQRKRNIIWFNPPYSKTVETNIGKKFLKLVDKHFPRNNRYHKIFNRNNLKVSYGCMPNIQAIINSHNKKIVNTEESNLQRGTCNCNDKNLCPLNGECNSTNVLYEASLSSTLINYDKKTYKGITAPQFKIRYGNHLKSFNNTKYKNETELSKETWRLRDKGADYDIKWKIIRQHATYNPVSQRCALCLNEKLEILESRGQNSLNKRSEIVSTCRHKLKYMLKSFDVR